MPRTSIQNVRSIGDPLQSWNWDIFIPRMPGSNDSREFTFKAQTSIIPGFMLESVPVALHGVELRFAGRKNYSHSFPVTILETNNMSTRDMFVRWNELARSWINNAGTSKDVYSTDMRMILWDDTPKAIKTVMVVGVWPETVDDAQMDGQTSGVVTYNISFSYDLTEDFVGEI